MTQSDRSRCQGEGGVGESGGQSTHDAGWRKLEHICKLPVGSAVVIGTVAIVGANLAGYRTAATLRDLGFDGRIHLIGDEFHAPYERPPLSKGVLLGNPAAQDIFFHPPSWYADNAIDLMLGDRVESLDLGSKMLRFADGTSLGADTIVLATGAHARRLTLAGADAPNVHYLRTKNDADGLGRRLVAGARIVVIGMGVIGAEVAASARTLGCAVTVIEPAPVPMARALGTRFGQWLAGVHGSQGIHMKLSCGVEKIETDASGMACGVLCSDGTRVECDALVVGIGVTPATELAERASIATANGVIVDGSCRTSHTAVFAAGDVTNQPHFFGGRIRMENYNNAADQGAIVARAIVGQEGDHQGLCSFWSDQYDLNIQVVGMIGDDLTQVVRGDMESGQFTVLFLRDDTLCGLLAVNAPSEMLPGQRIIEQRMQLDQDMLRSQMPLRDMLDSAPKQRAKPPQGEVVIDNLIKLCLVGDVSEGAPVPCTVDGLPQLAVYAVEGSFFVTDNRCTHGAGELSDGLQEGSIIECPFHGGAFDIRTGEPTAFPCKVALRTYPVTVADGWIAISKG